MADFPLITDPTLPVNRENLALPPRAELGEVELQKGNIEDYRFDLERQEALQTAEVTKLHTDYLEKHPELRSIISDLLSSVLMDKPSNVYQYFADYFDGVK
ncbi:hypothetical protein SS50377_21463 [Spironucleus salmonicida]|uniref:RIIa domain-containing protein n=1 Tax=Spironucleus salmonicida TaxID=348837 RepID=V6LD43_9EUKA|nr:hypothetical protein SS50377_21463 [Spironucleus salmonicida]|eukprot:EST42415.1 hypothetical protein SS50377_17970 [Spironucleus salmonicida]